MIAVAVVDRNNSSGRFVEAIVLMWPVDVPGVVLEAVFAFGSVKSAAGH